MILVGVRDLKSKLSQYIAEAKTGVDVIVTEHGKPVARLIREPVQKKSVKEKLYKLAEEGGIELPQKKKTNKKTLPFKSKGRKTASDLLLESR